MVVVISGRERVGREEFIHREFDVAEDFAGIIVVAAAGALFVRQAVVIDGNEQLGIPLQPDDGKLTKGDKQTLGIPGEAKVTAKASADAGGNLRDFALAAVTAFAQIH